MAKKHTIGRRINISYARDLQGWWWVEGMPEDFEELPRMHGPFRTKAEAQASAHHTVFGPDCEIKDGGTWDAAWGRKQ